MVVDGLVVGAVDLVPADAVLVVEVDGEVADDVFDELGVLVGVFGDELLIRAFEDGEDLCAGGLHMGTIFTLECMRT